MGELTEEEVKVVADAMHKEYGRFLPYRSLARVAITALRAMDREKAQSLTDRLEAKGITLNPDVRVTVGPDGSDAGWIDGVKIRPDSPSGT